MIISKLYDQLQADMIEKSLALPLKSSENNFSENDRKHSYDLPMIFGQFSKMFRNLQKMLGNFWKTLNLFNLVVCRIKRKLHGGLKYEFYFHFTHSLLKFMLLKL